MIAMPTEFTQSTIEREGEPGAEWLAELPGIVEDLLGRWGCMSDGEVMHRGVGVIVPVRRRDEEPAVLKVSFPHPGNVYEPDAHVAWAGRGAVLMHERDDERFAMLLERVHTATLAELEDGGEVVTVAGRINHRLAVRAPSGLPRLREQADAWEEQLHKDAAELTHPLPRQVLDAAVATSGSWAGYSRTPSSMATSMGETSCAPAASRGWPSTPRGTRETPPTTAAHC